MARTMADRKAEAARYQQMTEQATIPTVSLDKCHFKAHCGKLTLPSECVGIPSQLYIKSHHTGRKVLFKPITPDHPLYDEDQWDGEQMVYEPVVSGTKVKVLVIYNQY